tara:strand:+ start:1318 stop:1485 length:168 start_codon:yes stop_codon:yes gene_type:complete
MPFRVRNTKFDLIMENAFSTEAEAQSWIDEKSAGGDPVTDTPHINNTDCVIEEYS